MRNTTNIKSNEERSFPIRMTSARMPAISENGSVRARKLAFVSEAKYETG